MNAETTEKTAALAAAVELTLPQRAAVALDTPKHEADLRALVAKSVDVKAVLDSAGRDQAHRMAMNLKAARLAVVNAAKGAREDAQHFAKAVITEERRLIAIVEPEEERVLALRDAFDAKLEAEKQAKIAAERARTEAITKAIADIWDRETAVTRARAANEMMAQINTLIGIDITEAVFQERYAEAVALKESKLAAMYVMHAEQTRKEQDAAAEKARQAEEAQRIEAERATLRAEMERMKAEKEAMAVEKARIEAEQQAHARQLAAQAEAQEQEARQQREQLEGELKREREAAQAELDAQKYAADWELAHALKPAEDVAAAARAAAVCIKVAPAVVKEPDADAVRLANFYQEPLPVATPTASTASIYSGPSDMDVVDAVAEAFGMTRAAAIDRLECMALPELRGQLAAEAAIDMYEAIADAKAA